MNDYARQELEAEHNGYHDYHNELWASEKASMADEGNKAEQQMIADGLAADFRIEDEKYDADLIENDEWGDIPF